MSRPVVNLQTNVTYQLIIETNHCFVISHPDYPNQPAVNHDTCPAKIPAEDFLEAFVIWCPVRRLCFEGSELGSYFAALHPMIQCIVSDFETSSDRIHVKCKTLLLGHGLLVFASVSSSILKQWNNVRWYQSKSFTDKVCCLDSYVSKTHGAFHIMTPAFLCGVIW